VEIERLRTREWVVAIAAGLVAMFWQFVTFNGFPNDHYVAVARARQILLGAWPVRDFVDPGMPLTYVPSVLARALFGDVVGAEMAVVAVGIGIGAAATAVCASRLAPVRPKPSSVGGRSTLIGCAVVLLEVLASPRSYSYPKMLLYGVAGCVIVAVAARPARGRILLAGGLTAAAFLVRHDHGLYVGIACATAILLSAQDIRAAARRFAGFGLVVAALLVPWALAVQYYAGLIPYFRSAIAFSRREADINVLRDWPSFHGPATVSAGNAEAWLYYLFYALPLICVGLAVWRRVTKREPWAGESAAVGAIALMALAVDVGFLRKPLATRLPDAIVPACLLGAWLLGLAWSARPRWAVATVLGRGIAASLLLVTAAAVWQVGDVSDKLDAVGVFDDLDHVREHVGDMATVAGRQEMDVVRFPSRVSAGLVPFFRYLDRCTVPGDRLFVSGSYPDVFVLGRRGFAGGHVAFMEGFYSSAEEQSLTRSRMRRESVPFVLLVLDEQAAFAGGFPMLLAHITSSYDVLADVPIEGMKGVRILVDRMRRRTGVDLTTGWPCFR
jgi:hypothetical protein